MKTNELAIKTPCTLDFGRMTPADGGRFCGDCKKVVRDLSAMREEDARALVMSAAGAELCVRVLHDRHGNVFFGQRTTPTDLVAPSLLVRAKRAVRATVAMAAPLAAMACSIPQADEGGSASQRQHVQTTDPDEQPPEVLMGGVAAPDPQPEPDAGADAAADADGGATTTKEDERPDAEADAGDAAPNAPPKT